VDLGADAVGGGDPLGNTVDRRFDGILHLRAEGTGGAAKHRPLGDHVPGVAGMKLGHRDHRRVQGVDRAAGHGLGAR